MPKIRRIYKVDVNELVNDVALLLVTAKDAEASIITDFCSMYSIPLDSVKLGERVKQYNEIKQALQAASPGKPKTTK